MLQVIAEKKVLKSLNNYHELLSKTGYVKHTIMKRFLAYLFFVDFVEFTHDFFTRADYDLIAEVLSRLFTNGGCLLPYPVFCTNRATVGRAHYLGSLKLRITEDIPLPANLKRETEDDLLRTTER